MENKMHEAIRKYVTVPPYIQAIANACYYDLMHGPSFLLIPQGDVTRVNADCVATYYNDLAESKQDGDIIEETYTSRAADALREWINELPGTLYYDSDADYISESEPEGEEIDGEWFDPPPYYMIENLEILTALFGKTFAREFE